jgi:hypothetical protein
MGTTILGMEKTYRRVYQSQDWVIRKLSICSNPRPSNVVVREIVRNEATNAYKVKWKLALCRAFAGLSLGADVNSSNFQEALRPVSQTGHVQDPRSIFGSDHQRLI